MTAQIVFKILGSISLIPLVIGSFLRAPDTVSRAVLLCLATAVVAAIWN